MRRPGAAMVIPLGYQWNSSVLSSGNLLRMAALTSVLIRYIGRIHGIYAEVITELCKNSSDQDCFRHHEATVS